MTIVQTILYAFDADPDAAMTPRDIAARHHGTVDATRSQLVAIRRAMKTAAGKRPELEVRPAWGKYEQSAIFNRLSPLSHAIADDKTHKYSFKYYQHALYVGKTEEDILSQYMQGGDRRQAVEAGGCYHRAAERAQAEIDGDNEKIEKIKAENRRALEEAREKMARAFEPKPPSAAEIIELLNGQDDETLTQILAGVRTVAQ